jgi:lysophospholipase L1-like esterase
VVIVAIGDSITYGQHLEDRLKSWPYLVRAGIEANHHIVPAGVPGDTTRLGLERFPQDVQNPCPAAVIIQFGHNDCNRWETDRGLPRVSMAAFKANLFEMIDRARMFGAVPYLCTLTPSRRPEPHPTDCARYDVIIRRVADEEGVRIIDARAAFEAEVDQHSLLMGDGLHLSVAGHQVYAEAVQKVLDSEPLP